MSGPVTDSDEGPGDLDPALVELVAELSERQQAGEAPDPREILEENPRWADELRHLLPALRLIVAEGRGRRDEWDPRVDSALRRGSLGDFRILREVGRGGMGIVYEAMQQSPLRRVALKVLAFGATDARRMERFRLEARAAGLLAHDNIAPIFASGEDSGVCFIAMRFIEGATLEALIRRLRAPEADAPEGSEGGPGPSDPEGPPAGPAADRPHDLGTPGTRAFFRAVARLGLQAARALQHAHEQDVIHRDIKPANLMVDRQGKLWVTDFGLARLAGDDILTRTSDRMGTPRYMSPEQAGAGVTGVDHRTDIYSLGATLYEALGLAPAVPGKDAVEVFRRILEGEPRPVRRIDRRIPADLETILLKAMAREPSARYASAGEMAEDLARFLNDRPVLARRPGPLDHAGKFVRRHRGLAVAALVAVPAVLASLVLGIVVVERQRAIAQRAVVALSGQRDYSDRLLYASQLQLARRDWQDGRLGNAQQALRALAPARPGDPDPREFAWGYLWGRTREAARLLDESVAAIRSSAVSADRRFLVARDSAEIALYDLARERLVWRVANPTSDDAGPMALGADGHGLAVASGRILPDRTVANSAQLYDTSSGRALLDRPIALPGNRSIRALGLAPGGRTLLVHHVSPDDRPGDGLQAWDLAGAPPVLRYEVPSTPVALVSPDGSAFLADPDPGGPALFDARDGRPIAALKGAAGRLAGAAAFSRAGDVVAAWEPAGGRVLVWSTRDGRLLGAQAGFDSPVTTVSVGPGGKTLATVQASQEVRLHDLERGTTRTLFPPARTPSPSAPG